MIEIDSFLHKKICYVKILCQFPYFCAAICNSGIQLVLRDELFYCPSVGAGFVTGDHIKWRVTIVEAPCFTMTEFVRQFHIFVRRGQDMAWVDTYDAISIVKLHGKSVAAIHHNPIHIYPRVFRIIV